MIKGYMPREFTTSPLRVYSRPHGEFIAHCVINDVLGGIFLLVIDHSCTSSRKPLLDLFPRSPQPCILQ